MRGGEIALFALAALCGSCHDKTMASRAQCERMRDRYIDLVLSVSAAAPSMTSEQRARFRGQIATESLTGPYADRLDARCEKTVTQAAFTCAVQAPTLDAWQRCFQ
jgi:hypothetical protein